MTLATWIDEDDEGLPPLPPYHCEKCGLLLSEPNDGSPLRSTVEKPCRVGNCTNFACARCGYEYGGWGPVGCPCQSRDPNIRRIRQMYRARRR